MNAPKVRVIGQQLILAIVLLSLIGNAGADQNTQSTPSNSQLSQTLANKLRVVGDGTRISIEAQRADVLSVLTGIFKQAGKQFSAEPSVRGQVTLVLTEQPFDVIVTELCQQCYMKTTVTPSGIYRFTRDDSAIKGAFEHLKSLNTVLRNQLRSYGFAVPADETLLGPALKSETDKRSFDQAVPPDRAKSPQTDPFRGTSDAPTTPDRRIASEAGNAAGLSSGSNRQMQRPEVSGLQLNEIHSKEILTGRTTYSIPLSNGSVSSLYLKQNNLVWFSIPDEKPQPVANVLQQFSRQSGVPILLDQSIPETLKFRVWGTLSPRQVSEAMNILAPTAHLQWRWIGGSIFVVPAPEFEVIIGDLQRSMGVFRSVYPAPQKSNQSGPVDQKGNPD